MDVNIDFTASSAVTPVCTRKHENKIFYSWFPVTEHAGVQQCYIFNSRGRKQPKMSRVRQSVQDVEPIFPPRLIFRTDSTVENDPMNFLGHALFG